MIDTVSRAAPAPHDARKPSVSVVICTYSGGRFEDLRQAVDSVAQQTYPALETIVVVDHDAAVLKCVRAEFPGVVATANTGARGLSDARNTGLSLARGEIVAFLDDDATAARDWLELIAPVYADERVLGVGGSIDAAWQHRPRWFPSEFEWVVGCTYRGMPVVRAHVRNIVGANMSFRRSVFDRVGVFRTGIGRIGTKPIGCEETEFCIRAARVYPHGTIVYEPLARVRHRVPSTRSRWRYFLARCYAEGLSKAQVAEAAGAGRALATERAYVSRTLPLGFLSGLAAAATLRDTAGALRSAAIAAGLLTTIAGFCVGQFKRALAPSRPLSEEAPA
jgi:glycosyltransferase involved in cell wall biosynthesis